LFFLRVLVTIAITVRPYARRFSIVHKSSSRESSLEGIIEACCQLYSILFQICCSIALASGWRSGEGRNFSIKVSRLRTEHADQFLFNCSADCSCSLCRIQQRTIRARSEGFWHTFISIGTGGIISDGFRLTMLVPLLRRAASSAAAGGVQ
jgi:hypothetical protein